MSREAETKILLLLDKRTVERNIRKGLVTRKDQEKFLKSLPDLAENIAPRDIAPAEAPAAEAPAAEAPSAPGAPGQNSQPNE